MDLIQQWVHIKLKISFFHLQISIVDLWYWNSGWYQNHNEGRTTVGRTIRVVCKKGCDDVVVVLTHIARCAVTYRTRFSALYTWLSVDNSHVEYLRHSVRYACTQLYAHKRHICGIWLMHSSRSKSEMLLSITLGYHSILFLDLMWTSRCLKRG